MSNLISLGSFNKLNGRNTSLGLASGLDSTGLIEDILASRTASVKEIQDNVTFNGKKTAAVSELKTLLDRFRTTVDFLRSPPGVGNDNSDFFKHTSTSLTSSTSTAASTYISVTSEAGATINSYSVDDIVLAKAHILRKDGFTSRTESVVEAMGATFTPGTFELNGAEYTLEAGDSLNVIKSKINAISETSGVVADIVQVSSNSYSLLLKAKDTGVANKIAEYGDGDVGDPAAGLLLFGGSEIAFTEQQGAVDASFDLDGLTITRSSNVINDALDKVTFSLLSASGVDDPTITVGITHDNDLITSGVSDFINAFNELKFFISKQTERDENGDLVETAVLGDDDILRDVLSQIEAQLNSTVSGLTSGDPTTLFALGIDTIDFPGDSETPATTNIFILDEDKFTAALAEDFEAFRKVFAYDFTSSSADLGIFARSNSSTLTRFKLDIDTSFVRANGDKVRVLDADTDELLFNMDYSNGLITGQAGTALAGMQLVYTGDGSDIITVNATQGIADKLFNILDNYLTEDTGLIDSKTQSIIDENTRLEDRIATENAQIDAERELLISKFTYLEAIISQANSVLSFLQAQRDANNQG